MKKFLFIAATMLLATASINSMNTVTMGDSVRIHPNRLGGYSQHQVTMFNDGYCDSWTMNVTYPEGLMVKLVAGITPLDGMTIPFCNRFGEQQVYEAPLNVSAAYATIGSTITERGYWDIDEDGLFDSYGTVKWCPGAHSLFEFNFYLEPSFRAGYVIFDGRITSGADERGAILSDVRIFKKCWVWVGYPIGDVTGNEAMNVDDVTALISYVLNGKGNLDEFGEAAADVNQDGNVTIADVTALIGKVLRK